MWQAIYLRNFLLKALADKKGVSGAAEYRGYLAYLREDDVTGKLHGQVTGARNVITFEGNSRDELAQAFRDSVDEYLKVCEERGHSPR